MLGCGRLSDTGLGSLVALHLQHLKHSVHLHNLQRLQHLQMPVSLHSQAASRRRLTHSSDAFQFAAGL